MRGKTSLLAAGLLALFGLGAEQSHGAASRPRNGVIAYAYVSDTVTRFQIYTTNSPARSDAG